MAECRATLLIVEDDVDVAEMLTAYFRTQEYEVLAVNWGEDAVKVCRSYHPDLVILDIRLPDISGFEVAQRLRENQRTRDIPIIFLTEKRDRVDRMQGLEIGADDYITKPFDIQELRLRVRNSLRRSGETSLTNPITGLPEGTLVDERLRECLASSEWALLLVSIDNLTGFRDAYGFVASDDVQRAVSLMIQNALRDIGGAGDFLGQINAADFLVFTQPGSLLTLDERIRARIGQSLDYFYPLKDRSGGNLPGRLRIRTAALRHGSRSYKTIEEMKEQIFLQLE